MQPAGTGRGRQIRLCRAVEHSEVQQIVASGTYQTAGSIEGKYFYPTVAQAERFRQLNPHRSYELTFTEVDEDFLILPGVYRGYLPAEGEFYFVPERHLHQLRPMIGESE